jgi:hypothetical protein
MVGSVRTEMMLRLWNARQTDNLGDALPDGGKLPHSEDLAQACGFLTVPD